MQKETSTTNGAVDKRTKRWQRHRQNILKSAGKLFWDKGYMGTSTEQIAKNANVNKATIYYYFANKSTILYELLLKPLEAFIGLAVPIAKSKMRANEKLEAIIKGHIKWQISHIGFAGIGLFERKNLPLKLRRKYIRMRDKYENIYRKIISEGIKQGEFFFDDPNLTTMFILGLVNSIIQWYKPKGRLSADDISLKASRFILQAFKADQID